MSRLSGEFLRVEGCYWAVRNSNGKDNLSLETHQTAGVGSLHILRTRANQAFEKLTFESRVGTKDKIDPTCFATSRLQQHLQGSPTCRQRFKYLLCGLVYSWIFESSKQVL